MEHSHLVGMRRWNKVGGGTEALSQDGRRNMGGKVEHCNSIMTK